MRAPGDLQSVASKGGAVPEKCFSMLCDSMPWGAFLSEGAYKKVYRVVNARTNPWTSGSASVLALAGGGARPKGRSSGAAASGWVEEAVSVMDVKGIMEAGAGSVVEQELRVSLLVSALVRRSVCPNFVETFGVFGTDFAPPPALWGADGNKHPRGKHPPTYPALPASALLGEGGEGGGGNSDDGSSAFALAVHHTAAVKALQPKQRPRPARPPLGGGGGGGSGRGRHQYIRMELCTHGDLEEFLHVVPGNVLAPEALLPLAFQMCFALYAAQTEFDLRHYDVKLLNFLLKDMPPNMACPRHHKQKQQQKQMVQQPPVRGRRRGAAAAVAGDEQDEVLVNTGGNDEVRVCYGVAGQSFVLRLPAEGGAASHRLWVKLGDFGTADVEPGTVGLPIGLEQFTTLENSPIEQLLLGTGATQTFAADTWALGLSLLHLFTGHCPYEELLVEVKCPEELRLALESVWSDPELEAVYGVVVAAAGEEEEEEGGDECGSGGDSEDDAEGGGDEEMDGERRSGSGGMGRMDRTLADTLYRFLVLFGLPSSDALSSNELWQENPVWRACLAYLASSVSDVPPSLRYPTAGTTAGDRRKGKGKGKAKSKEAAGSGVVGGGPPTKAVAKRVAAGFAVHRGQWGVQCGSSPAMAAARVNLEATGAMELLLCMANFDATMRPTMFDCLKSELFKPLRADQDSAGGGDKDTLSSAAAVEKCDYVFNHFL
jgi:serine/threonine protein kinase